MEVVYDRGGGFYIRVRRVGLVAVRVTLEHRFKRCFHASKVFWTLNPFTLWMANWGTDVMSFLSSAMKVAGATRGEAHASDDTLKKKCPAVAEFLFAGVDDEGNPRRGATLTVFCEQGLFKVVLRERERQLDLWGTGPTLWECLHDLDRRLQEPQPEWRRQNQAGKKK